MCRGEGGGDRQWSVTAVGTAATPAGPRSPTPPPKHVYMAPGWALALARAAPSLAVASEAPAALAFELVLAFGFFVVLASPAESGPQGNPETKLFARDQPRDENETK